MHTIQDPGEPEPYLPPRDDEEPDDPAREPSPFERPPFERDPEAQRAPGDGQETGSPPPMQAGGAEENVLDGPGIAREPVGNDNIRDGTVGGVMGGPHQSMGQGQGG